MSVFINSKKMFTQSDEVHKGFLNLLLRESVCDNELQKENKKVSSNAYCVLGRGKDWRRIETENSACGRESLWLKSCTVIL